MGLNRYVSKSRQNSSILGKFVTETEPMRSALICSPTRITKTCGDKRGSTFGITLRDFLQSKV